MADTTTLTKEQQIDRINAISAYAGGNRFEQDENRLVRDPATRRIISSPDYGSDKEISVAFTVDEVFSQAASYDAGVPTYVPMDFVTITTPGNKLNMIHRPVSDFDMWRFPLEWEQFKAGNEAIQSGTSLEAWPLLSKGQIKDLKYNNVHTVEQIANLSDSVSGVLRAFYSMKLKAAAFLEGRADKTAEVELQNKLDERDARLAALEAQLASLLAVKLTEAVEPKSKRA